MSFHMISVCWSINLHTDIQKRWQKFKLSSDMCSFCKNEVDQGEALDPRACLSVTSDHNCTYSDIWAKAKLLTTISFLTYVWKFLTALSDIHNRHGAFSSQPDVVSQLPLEVMSSSLRYQQNNLHLFKPSVYNFLRIADFPSLNNSLCSVCGGYLFGVCVLVGGQCVHTDRYVCVCIHTLRYILHGDH